MSRKLDLSRFIGDEDEEEDGFSAKKQLELNELKSRTFSHGITKKSRKDLEKEAEEKKRLDEEKAAALVLAEYTDAFDGPSSGIGGPASRGRPIGIGGGFVRSGGIPMQPPVNVPTQPFVPPVPRGPAAMGYARSFRPPPREPSPPPVTGPKPKGKRAMDSFLQEIKSNQQSREQRLGHMAKLEGSSISALAAWETSSGGRNFTEQESTNLFVGNLPHSITEESLGLFFAKLGPVGTVKIMWPRGDEDQSSVGSSMSTSRRIKAGLQGFVAYMKRKDAEKAVQEYDGLEWGGSMIKVGWSKPVPVPQRALYDGPTEGDKRSREKSLDRSRRRRRSPSTSSSRSPSPDKRRKKSTSRSPDRSGKRRGRSRSASYSSSSSRPGSRSRSRSPPPKRLSARDKWLAKIPAEQVKFIKAVAGKVRDHGKGFEDVLKDREKDNPKFAFFFDEKIPDYHLYRSNLSSRYRIPTPPPPDFEDEGYASIYSTDSAEDSEKERTEKGKMGRLSRKRFEAILRLMSGKRAEIARAMEFALKRAEAADEVADLICQSLKVDGTPVPRKLARLHLVSDILHNSASPLPNVWKYRLVFESRLPDVFAHLYKVYNSLHAYSGNISADVFKAQVGAVLDIWERWIVFTSEVQDNLRKFFDGTKLPGQKDTPAESQRKEDIKEETRQRQLEEDINTMSGFKSGGFKSSFKPLSASGTGQVPAPSPVGVISTSAPVMTVQEGAAADADLDGEAMDEDLDGEAMEDEDLDGETMEMDEDLDGEAM